MRPARPSHGEQRTYLHAKGIRVVDISIALGELEEIDAKVEEAKRRGFRKASRSRFLREAARLLTAEEFARSGRMRWGRVKATNCVLHLDRKDRPGRVWCGRLSSSVNTSPNPSIHTRWCMACVRVRAWREAGEP